MITCNHFRCSVVLNQTFPIETEVPNEEPHLHSALRRLWYLTKVRHEICKLLIDSIQTLYLNGIIGNHIPAVVHETDFGCLETTSKCQTIYIWSSDLCLMRILQRAFLQLSSSQQRDFLWILMDINLPLKIKNNKKVPYSDETVTNHHETFQRGEFLN